MPIRRYARCVAIALTLVASTPLTALAQSDEATLGVGYSFLRLVEGPDVNMPAGWLASFAAPIDRSAISLVGEVAGNYRRDFGETFRVHTFQAGMRLSGRTAPGVDPFVQFLLGGMSAGCCGSSSTNFMIEPGVGVDLAMSRGLAFRAGISIPIVFDDGDAFKALRLQAGIVLPIGSR